MRFLAWGLLVLLASPLTSSQAQDADEQIGRYQVSEAGGTFLLLDTVTGKTWLLRQTDNDQIPAVWVPVPQFEDPEDLPQLTAKPARVAAPALLQAHQSVIADLMRGAAALDVEEKQLAPSLGVDHPNRVRLREQIRAIEAQIDDETQKMLTAIDEQIMALQFKLADLEDKFGPEHPDIKETKRQIERWKDYLVVLETEY